MKKSIQIDLVYTLYRISLLTFFFTLLTACSLLKASPAPDSGFLPFPELLVEMRERSPFNRSWIYDKEQFSKMKDAYKKIYVKKVNTSFLEKKINADDKSRKSQIQRVEELREVARYMHEQFKLAIRNYPEQPLMVVDQIGPETFVLELAIVELYPTNPAINTLGTAAGFFVPGGGLIKYAGQGSIAIEGIVRDGGDNRVLVQFKDREGDKASPFTLKDFQKYAHVREAVFDWANQYAELSATPLDHKVEDSSPFSLEIF